MIAKQKPKASPRKPLRNVLLACMAVLLLAQALIGSMSLSALNRLTVDNTADRVELVAGQVAAQIQTGMNLGKPLAQYFGLSALLARLSDEIPDFAGASVVLADGRVLASTGGELPAQELLRILQSGSPGDGKRTVKRPSGMAQEASRNAVTVAVPLTQGKSTLVGAMLLQLKQQDIEKSRLATENLAVLALTTLAAAGVLVCVFRFAMPLHQLAIAGKARLLVPLLVLLIAQGVYAAFTVHTFRSVWLEVTRDNTRIVGEALQRDLNKVLAYGIAPERLRGVERPMSRLATAFPIISELRLIDAKGALLVRADASGSMRGPVPTADPAYTLDFPLYASTGGPVSAQLQILLDEGMLAGGVRARVLDAATVVAVSLVAAVELLLLLGLLMNRAFAVGRPSPGGAPHGLDDPAEVGKIVRPVMFGFLFALALPLSFLPLYARSLLTEGGLGTLSPVLMALPIAAEMGCGLLTALLAGRLTDRHGWPLPVLGGLLLSLAGNLACAVSSDLFGFVLARALVGLGYGLTWMGLQGFIVLLSPRATRGRNMASVIAGLFAGHLSGAAVGAMLTEQVGLSFVFLIGVGLLLLPAIGVLTLMWPYRHLNGARNTHAGAQRPEPARGEVRRLLLSRDYFMLLAGCVIPFSIAQVGLLTFALPLVMEAQGASAASVGRLLMLYGLCVIYIGPTMGKLADRSQNKRMWVVSGGLLGSAGLILLYFNSGAPAMAVSIFLLALAGCFVGAAQTPYMLAMQSVEDYGAGGATSIMRAADKFGQMLGPLLVATLFASMGMSVGLALTGVLYLAATLAFMLVKPQVRLARSNAAHEA